MFLARRGAMNQIEDVMEIPEVAGVVDFLLANPVFLAPLLLVAAVFVYAVVKKLLKLAVILAIAGGLYVLLLRYFG